jgi:ATP-dependent protease ClpP protease subunit
MVNNKRPVRRRGEDEPEEDEDEVQKPKGFRIKSTPIGTVYTCHVNQPFLDVRQFEDLVAVLDTARQGDIVEIKLSTPGGAVHAVLPVMSAIAATNAQVFVHAVSDVASAGTFLLMLADDVYVNQYATLMFHQVTFGAYGPGNQVGDRVDYVMKSSSQMMRDLYHGFLTEDEITAMLSGKEFWMDKNEFETRYAKRKALMQLSAEPGQKKTSRRKKAQAAPVEE